MGSSTGSELEGPLVAELARALELVRQLESHLSNPAPIDLCKSVAPKILSSIQRSILMAKSSDPDGEQQAAGDSPRSESSSLAFKDHSRKELIKKRKTLHKWTNQVRLTPGTGGVEGLVDDGYSWRKYGQKDILGAKHPRAYYRCTHRHTQGCSATKQVQRSDEDPLMYEITYVEAHTCLQKPQRASASACQVPQRRQHQKQDLLLSFRAGLKVKTEGPELEEAQQQTSREGNEFHVFSAPTFPSTVATESIYFSSFDDGINLQTSDSEITEMISRGNSASNLSLVDMDFMLEELDFEQDFQFDASSFFS
ncbi:WRKY transcription factor [Musa troglodytarum]|uniref:WRKY transcription factor n=1 Tax=Musa troglodytarum TaxID=320322 RepID=A0A9E7JAK9_9LILI|nr:WRKY transcription factor [Musa troglodytarum]URD73322.1 WRKY transcription factor [Musa troglodytarum]